MAATRGSSMAPGRPWFIEQTRGAPKGAPRFLGDRGWDASRRPPLGSLAVHEPDPEQNDRAPQHRPEADGLPEQPGGNGDREERLEIEKRADTRGGKALERVEPEHVGHAGADDPQEE